MSNRHKARELALQILFQCEFAPKLDFADSLDLYRKNFDLDASAYEYARRLIEGVLNNKTELDAMLQSQIKNWSLERLALVDLEVMRLAVFELKHLDQDAGVAINEAIELAKKYGTTDSGAFVNGILDQIAKENS